MTMPRIKALTTGSVPSFLDMVLNFAESDTTSTLAHQDSWVAQIKARLGQKMVMYGDDTWLKLFPGSFDRADGTTSFFVSDFTEVDHNVTRHISGELAKEDWSLMVLHYLGLDHIGHKSGPRSVNMAPKQREMDEIIKRIYESMQQNPHLKSSLLVLCGDHGMNDAGNHGGSSAGEVTAAMALISPSFSTNAIGLQSPVDAITEYSFYQTVEQSDIVPTLASLLGVPIPLNNLGIIIPAILDLWPRASDRLQILHANSQQIANLAKATYEDQFDLYARKTACEETKSNEAPLPCLWFWADNAIQSVKAGSLQEDSAIDLQWRFLRTAQQQLSGTASNYHTTNMWTGIAVAATSLLLSITAVPARIFSQSDSGAGFAVSLLCHCLTMFASSYVEEEHQFWYWACSGWLLYLSIKEQRRSESSTTQPSQRLLFTLTMFGYGLMRRINSTGQKYAALPSISSHVFPSEPWALWFLVVATYVLTTRELIKRASHWGDGKSRQLSFLPIPACIAAFAFKVAFVNADAPELLERFPVLKPLIAITSRYALVGQARVVFLGIVHMLACALYYETPWKRTSSQERGSDEAFIHTFHHLLTLFLLTQSRVNNIPIFLLFYIQLSCARAQPSLLATVLDITFFSFLFQQSSFYAFGGTNTISSIDLSSAYNGIAGYNVYLVGILTFVSNWAGPIWWTSGTALLLVERMKEDASNDKTTTSLFTLPSEASRYVPAQTAERDDQYHTADTFFTYFAILTVFATMSALSAMVACTFLREHLFIWTVFSPKYLYVIAWTFGYHFLVNGICVWGVLGRLAPKF